MNGNVEDPYNEFFIQPDNSFRSKSPQSVLHSTYEKNSSP
ncbi:hypothetical protein CEXT_348111, partial [Caerostris extrusa]